VSGAIDQAYLRWFFNTTIEVTRSKPTPPRGVYDLRIERLYQDTVTLPVDAQFDSLDSALFEVSAQRVEVLAERLRALEYMPPPYGFLPAFQGDDDRARHLVNFLFFMVGIDHETHRGAIRYEDTLDGVFRHGSESVVRARGACQDRRSWTFSVEPLRERHKGQGCANFHNAIGPDAG